MDPADIALILQPADDTPPTAAAADLAGRIAFMTAGGVPGIGPWRACADAAKS
jgi:hypothetical protein